MAQAFPDGFLWGGAIAASSRAVAPTSGKARLGRRSPGLESVSNRDAFPDIAAHPGRTVRGAMTPVRSESS